MGIKFEKSILGITKLRGEEGRVDIKMTNIRAYSIMTVFITIYYNCLLGSIFSEQ